MAESSNLPPATKGPGSLRYKQWFTGLMPANDEWLARYTAVVWYAQASLGYSGGVKHPGILNDILFKIVFGTEAGEPVLRALLNALLDLNGPQRIVELVLLNPISEKEYIEEKGPILDVKARDDAGRQYNIEVQLSPGIGDYIKRSIYYTSKFYSEQIKRGDSYDSLLKTISISILDFTLFPKSEEIHSTFSLWDNNQGFALSDVLELHYIELRKFSPSKPHELKTRFERWLYVLKFADLYGEEKSQLPDNLAHEEGISMALESMRRAYAKDTIRELIEAREKAERDDISRMKHARQEGVTQVARRMREEGIDPVLIEKTTGLSLEEIQSL